MHKMARFNNCSGTSLLSANLFNMVNFLKKSSYALMHRFFLQFFLVLFIFYLFFYTIFNTQLKKQ